MPVADEGDDIYATAQAGVGRLNRINRFDEEKRQGRRGAMRPWHGHQARQLAQPGPYEGRRGVAGPRGRGAGL